MIANIWLAECDFCGRTSRVTEHDILAHPLQVARENLLKVKIRMIFEERGWHVDESGVCICGACWFMKQALIDSKRAV